MKNFVVMDTHGNDVNGDENNAGPHLLRACYSCNGTQLFVPYEHLMSGYFNGGRGTKDDICYVGDAFGFVDVAPINELHHDGRIRVVVGAPNNHDTGYFTGQQVRKQILVHKIPDSWILTYLRRKHKCIESSNKKNQTSSWIHHVTTVTTKCRIKLLIRSKDLKQLRVLYERNFMFKIQSFDTPKLCFRHLQQSNRQKNHCLKSSNSSDIRSFVFLLKDLNSLFNLNPPPSTLV